MPNVNLFVAATLSIEMTAMGSILQDYQIKIFRLYDHLGGYAILVLIFELLFIGFTMHAIFHETKLIVKQRRNYFRKFWNLHAFVTCVIQHNSHRNVSNKESTHSIDDPIFT